ncbi:MAG TPA: hypothetical protein VM243_16050, partial [Phycisphaerae bacterium]|nr:hypothetical protein [Phycisphaerae bacterium]
TELATTAIPPTLLFLEPTQDVEVTAGQPLAVVIADEDPDSSAAIDFYLEPVPAPGAESDGEPAPGAAAFGLAGDAVVLATGLPEDLDGDGDSFSLTVPPELPAGDYHLVGVITDELATSIVRAPALVLVSGAEGDQNEAPSLELLEPAEDGDGSSVTP